MTDWSHVAAESPMGSPFLCPRQILAWSQGWLPGQPVQQCYQSQARSNPSDYRAITRATWLRHGFIAIFGMVRSPGVIRYESGWRPHQNAAMDGVIALKRYPLPAGHLAELNPTLTLPTLPPV